MKKIILNLIMLFVSFDFIYATNNSTENNKSITTETIVPSKDAEDTNLDTPQITSKKEDAQEKASNTKQSKWGYNIWGPMGILKMIDFGKNNQDFAKNGILEVTVMAGPTYEMIKDLKIGANIGIGAQFDINKVSYVFPIEANLLYDFNKEYSIFGGIDYSYGGLTNDISIYAGTNLMGYSLRIGYIPYAFSNFNSSRLTGSGFYFSFAGLFF
ncbi:hypothetical protein [Helicobacter cappadocius]|uniref:Outer membrane protein beta-barrel domain-containing protein n=1 Tax=Helicobacter cappadocius TaxID=3063998 RepID=A0AA90T950_9HELI|nr:MULTISPECIES: hypothetical protein [unclassified Helicobacter]MDO7252625.1 hypothetical protein [Helicobacter sp. faydin-H75]MDP2538492.1 hypothetical protein [Helicobacter sp. faydin-H76]